MGDGTSNDGAEKPPELRSIRDQVSSLVESCRSLQDAASSHTSRWQRETDTLSQQAVNLVSTMKKLQADVNSANEKDEISQNSAEKVV